MNNFLLIFLILGFIQPTYASPTVQETKKYIIELLERSSKIEYQATNYTFKSCELILDETDKAAERKGYTFHFFIPIKSISFVKETVNNQTYHRWQCDSDLNCLTYSDSRYQDQKLSWRYHNLTNNTDGMRLSKAISHLRSKCSGKKELFD